MMGSKERHFAPLLNISLEELVPHDHFYRHLERTLDLSCVREFVQHTYECGMVLLLAGVLCNVFDPEHLGRVFLIGATPCMLKQSARLATTKDSAASRHRVPRLLTEPRRREH